MEAAVREIPHRQHFLSVRALNCSDPQTKHIMIIGWRNQSRIRLISLPNDKFGSE